jgi:hypothetical protein
MNDKKIKNISRELNTVKPKKSRRNNPREKGKIIPFSFRG